MKGSLQDQLLGAGLIKKQDANNIKTAKKKQTKKSKATNTEVKNEAAELAEKARIKEQQKSQALNVQRKQEAEEKAVQAQIRQMIENNSIAKRDPKAAEDSEMTYNFTDDSKVKTMLVTPANHELISKGVIAIAKLQSKLQNKNEIEYYLIPAEAARKIAERDDASIVLINDYGKASNGKDSDEDDPYAGFEVPDDLMW